MGEDFVHFGVDLASLEVVVEGVLEDGHGGWLLGRFDEAEDLLGHVGEFVSTNSAEDHVHCGFHLGEVGECKGIILLIDRLIVSIRNARQHRQLHHLGRLGRKPTMRRRCAPFHERHGVLAIPVVVKLNCFRGFGQLPVEGLKPFEPGETTLPCGFMVGLPYRSRLRIVELALPVLHDCATGKSGIDDVDLLKFFADVSWDCPCQAEVWPDEHVASVVLRVVDVRILVVNVVQEPCPIHRVVPNEVDELIRDDRHGVGGTQLSVWPDH